MLPQFPVTTWLAIWGAFTGTVAWTVGLYNFWLDRPRIRLRMSRFSEAEVREINDSLVYGSGNKYILVEVANAGRRKVTVYQPEMWVRNEIGTLDHESPHYSLRDDQWIETTHPWKLYALSEGDAVTFLFRLADVDCFARLDLADTLARFYHLKTFKGSVQWWRGKLKASKKWHSMREAFFGRHRPRYHKDD